MQSAKSALAACLLLIAIGPAVLAADGPAKTVRVVSPPDAGDVVRNIAAAFADQVTRRCEAKVIAEGDADFSVRLAIEPGIGAEGYRISNAAASAVRIAGNDPLGLLYGVGKFLRMSRYDRGGFTPGGWRGVSTPQCPCRAIYLATHFMNYYEAAPVSEVCQYVRELGLWGANVLVLHFPTWQFKDFDDPKAKRSLERIRRLFQAAKAVGMKTGLVQCPNQGFAGAPRSILATKYPDDMGRHGTLGVNCCPSKPEGHAYLRKLYGRLFDGFEDIGLDYLVCWPYDEGGCGCKECWPWGARGFPRLSRDLAVAARERSPRLKLVLATWTFDAPPAGEWDGLAALLKNDSAWADFLMADAHEDFPRYPLDKGVPGGLPLLSFPEISMGGRSPWGGYGANPQPARLERLWKQTEGKLSGGMPYSEGIFEDINKAICLQFFWDKRRTAEQTLKEYIAYEYSPDAVDELLAAARVLENTWRDDRLTVGAKAWRDDAKLAAECCLARDLTLAAEKKLTPRAKAAWRWRVFVLRTIIDDEMCRHHGKLEGPALQAAFGELTRIYHAENAGACVRPPTVEPSRNGVIR